METQTLERANGNGFENEREERAWELLGFTLFTEINMYLNSELGESFDAEMAMVRERLPELTTDSNVNLPN